VSGKTILFLYGTLKRGQRNHSLLRGQRFIGVAATEPRYRLYDLVCYPGMVEDAANRLAVTGELWEVDAACLAELDALEDAPTLYVRQRIAVQGATGPVESYLYNQVIPSEARSGDSWPMR
jgi:gamma-glutamylaminecyclotransferase